MNRVRIVSRCTDKDPGFVLMRLRMLVNDRARARALVAVASAIIFTYTRAHVCTRALRSFAPGSTALRTDSSTHTDRTLPSGSLL